jgi:hypothetical protein
MVADVEDALESDDAAESDDGGAAEPDHAEEPSPAHVSRAALVARYGLLALLGAIAVGAIVLAIMLPSLHLGSSGHSAPVRTPGSPRATRAPATIEPVRPETFDAPVALAQRETRPASGDAAYLAALRGSGMEIDDAGSAISGGHAVCAYLAAGNTPGAAVAQALANNPALGPGGAQSYVTAAIRAYCP